MPSSITLRKRARISAHVVWDYLIRPIAWAPEDVPWSLEGLSAHWLTGVLGRGLPGVAVRSFDLGGGHQGSSARRQLHVQWNEAGQAVGLPTHLYTKSIPTVLTRLVAARGAGAEMLFYQLIRPDIDVEAPQLFHGSYEVASGRSIMIFDDLVFTKGARFCDYTTPISRAQADEIIDTLATLHGHFHGSKRFEKELTWLNTYEAFLRTGERSGIRIGHDQAMIEAADVIPADVVARREEIWPRLIESLELHTTGPRTLLHSDVHLGNWYITTAGHMGLCDWGCVCTGHWARDFAYAVSTTLSVEQRRDWERELLVHYLERMREQCGLATTLDVAFRQYRQQLFSALLMWTPTLCHPPTFPDMQPPEMSRTMIHRITTAIDDLDALDIEVMP